MDPIFEPAWVNYLTPISDYAGYGLIAVFAASFVWTCATLGGMVSRAGEIDKAEGNADQTKDDAK